MSIDALLQEATVVANFLRTHWTTQRDRKGTVTRRGLESARDPHLTAKTAALLTKAIQAASVAHTEVPAKQARKLPVRRNEARQLIGRLRSACQWWAKTHGSRDDLDSVRQVQTNDVFTGREGLSLSLANWARFGKEWRARLEGLGGFDYEDVARAFAMSAALREGYGKPPPNPAREARDQALRTIVELVARVRRAARFVFADDVETVRAVTSAGERAKGKRRMTRGTSNDDPRPVRAFTPRD